MRILTVRQPWAWAIIHGGKDIENRAQNLAGDYRGPVAIHAGLDVNIDALTDPNIIGAVALTRLFKGAGHPSTFKESPRGAIIGIVDLVGDHRTRDAPDQWIVLNFVGGYVCSACGDPVESEPCRKHQPRAYAASVGEVFIHPDMSPRRASDVPLWEDGGVDA